jgi:hypothetical protein
MSIQNIYCDESCHLPNDGKPVMVLGAIICPKDHARDVADSLRQVRARHGLSPHLEIKWGGVSPSKVDFFLDVITVFLDDPQLHYRAVIASKQSLQHDVFDQTHDDWYHKMYYQLLRHLVTSSSGDRFRVYLDIKDTKSAERIRTLHDVLCNKMRDFSHEVLEDLQVLRSHEVGLIQLTDLLTGAVSYAARHLQDSTAKVKLIEMLQTHTGRALDKTTWLSERKFNIFVWEPQV